MNFEILSLFDWRVILFVAIATSFVTKAIVEYTPPKIKTKLVLPVVAIIITVCRLPLEMKVLADWQQFVMNVLITMSIAILFYAYLGEYTVDKLFKFIRKNIGNELDDKVSDSTVNISDVQTPEKKEQ